MAKFRVEIKPLAQKQLKQHYKGGNKSAIKKIETIIKELSQDPYKGTGKPEQLKYSLAGYWSRRINQKDRMIYRVDTNNVIVFVISAMGHYDDT